MPPSEYDARNNIASKFGGKLSVKHLLVTLAWKLSRCYESPSETNIATHGAKGKWFLLRMLPRPLGWKIPSASWFRLACPGSVNRPNRAVLRSGTQVENSEAVQQASTSRGSTRMSELHPPLYRPAPVSGWWLPCNLSLLG